MDRRQNIIYNLVKLVGPGPWPQIVSPLPALDVRASVAGTNSMCNLMLGLPSPRKNQSRRCVFLSGGHAEDFKKIAVGRKVLANFKSRNEHAGDLDVITPGWDAPVVALSSKAAHGTPTINVDDDDEPDVDRMEPNAPETFRTNRLREIPCNAYRWVCRLVAARRQCSKRDCLGSSSGSAACHTKFNRLGRGTSTVLTSGLPS